jgi:DNA-directed RNA polymerase I subunit RPA49
VHNKRTKETVFRPAPLHLLQRQVKALKGLEPAAVTIAERLAARNQLGYAFGTKKAQAAIRAQERNKVDVSAMEGVVGHLQSRIKQNTDALPTKGQSHLLYTCYG